MADNAPPTGSATARTSIMGLAALRPWARWLFLLLWLAELLRIIGPSLIALPTDGLVELLPAVAAGLLIVLAQPLVSRTSRIVTGFGAVLTALVLLAGHGDPQAILHGLSHAVLFAGFLPTLRLLRGTAQQLPVIRLSQRRLAGLPPGSRTSGITLGSHAFGAALNTGSFPIMAAVMKRDADEDERRRFALAALRGMNLAPLWSPFFLAMGLASSYLPSVNLLGYLPIGLSIAGFSLVLSILVFGRSPAVPPLATASPRPGWITGLLALRPILGPLLILAMLIIALSEITRLGHLETIILAVPPICLLALWRKPGKFRRTLKDVVDSLGHNLDDMVIVAVALTLVSVVSELDVTTALLRDSIATMPAPLGIFSLIAGAFLLSLIGVHPMIPVALFLGALAGNDPVFNPHVLMGIALSCWTIGTMGSVSSMSLAVCAGLFRVPALRLMLSPNLAFLGGVLLIATTVLSAVQFLLG